VLAIIAMFIEERRGEERRRMGRLEDMLLWLVS
jgi:hypothetical protein